MNNTLLIFLDKYYEHGGSSNSSDRGLTIGGYESAWLADLVASYILEKLAYLFEETTDYHGIYRDDGIVVFIGKWNISDINRWLLTFQLRVNQLCRNPFLQFTCDIWGRDMEIKKENKISEKIKLIKGNKFPYNI